MPDFWLYEWIDEYEVGSTEEARKLLRPRSRSLRRLHELAAAVEWGPLAPYEGVGSALLAGRGIDLSGDLDCCHEVCQTKQVDELFGRALHYFDNLVIAGPPAYRYVDDLAGGDDQALHNLGEHVAALLYIRKIGADDLVTFVQKPPACAAHYEEHAREAGLDLLVERSQPWIAELARAGRVLSLEKHGEHWHFQFGHPQLEHHVWSTVPSREDGGEPTARDIAEAVCARYIAHLVSDVVAAGQLGLPLGASVEMHEDVLANARVASASVEDVAYELRLPLLENLPVRDVVKLRHDEWEYFESFRNALGAAIEKRLRDEGGDAAVVAERVAKEVLEPELIKLDRRLRVAARSFQRRAATSMVVGGVATTIGLITGVPLIAGAGIAALGTSLPAAHKYFEEQGSIESENMYWLWRLQRERPRPPA